MTFISRSCPKSSHGGSPPPDPQHLRRPAPSLTTSRHRSPLSSKARTPTPAPAPSGRRGGRADASPPFRKPREAERPEAGHDPPPSYFPPPAVRGQHREGPLQPPQRPPARARAGTARAPPLLPACLPGRARRGVEGALGQRPSVGETTARGKRREAGKGRGEPLWSGTGEPAWRGE